MNVNKLTLKKIFDTTERLEAPMFQRPYVWTKEKNWEPLLDAILLLAEQILGGCKPRPHFLGTLVLDQLKTPIGEVAARQIIDGQQRLTTLQLALAALRDICGFHNRDKYEKAFRKLTENEVPLSKNPDDIFKVWPTNADQPDFRETMRANSSRSVKKLPHSDPEDGWLIPDCYLYYYEKFGEWLKRGDDPCPDDRMSAIYQALLDSVHVVGIDLDKDDDPQEIFETLNALGTPLLPADLVKNFLFRAAEERKLDTSHLYETYWRTFDVRRDYWRQEVRQGRLKRPRIDLFLYHYLTLNSGEVLFDNQLFTTFKEFFASNHGQDAAKHMEVFRYYADIYNSFDAYSKESPEGVFFHRLELMDTMTIYPVLLEVFSTHRDAVDKSDLYAILADLESFLVRRFVCELTTKNYNRFFAQLIKDLRGKDGFTSSSIRDYLAGQRADTTRWPDDKEFRSAWMELPFYTHLKQSKTRLILEALESKLVTAKSEKIILRDTLTIEHLMPKGWEENWPILFDKDVLGEEEREKARRNKMIQRIGNLTLLTGSLNPALSNSAWDVKKGEISKHSSLSLNRSLLGYENWGEAQIEKRTSELLELALQIWPRSGEVELSQEYMAGNRRQAKADYSESEMSNTQKEYLEFFKDIKHRLEERISQKLPEPAPRSYYQIPVGKGAMHLEWAFHGRPFNSFGVELHFERSKKEHNQKYLALFEKYGPQIEERTGEKVLCQKEWGRAWCRMFLQKEEEAMTEEVKIWAVDKMASLYLILKPEFDKIRQGF